MGGYRGKPRRCELHREGWEVQRRSRRNNINEKKASATKEGVIGKYLEIYGGLKEGMGMKMYLYGLVDFAKTLKKLRFRVNDLDLPERRNRCTSSGNEEEY